MKEQKITFKTPTYYKGKNGYGDCHGIELTEYVNHLGNIQLTVLNSKGSSNAVKITIPKTDIQQLIDKLKMFL